MSSAKRVNDRAAAVLSPGRFRPHARGLQQRDVVLRGEAGEVLLRGEPDAPARVVHHPPEGDGVTRIRDEPQVGQHVLDLAPLVEAHAPDDLVRHPFPPERVLERPGLGVGPVQHRHGRVREPGRLPRARLDLVDDPPRLVVLVERLDEGDPLPARALGAERLPLPVHVLRDDGVRGVEDSLRGAVVALQADRASRTGTTPRSRGCCGCPRLASRRSTDRRRRPP